MKIARWMVCILAVAVPMLSFGLFRLLGFFVEALPDKGYDRSQFTVQEQAVICDMLRLKLAPGESVSTIYDPDEGSLDVIVYDVASKESFLARLRADKHPKSYIPWLATEFTLSGDPYDHWRLSTLFIGGSGDPQFVIGGFTNAGIPELIHAESVLLKDVEYHPVGMYLATHDWPFLVVAWSGIALEFGLIITLIILRRKAKKAQGL